jgi:hypothetical protein
MSLLKIGARLGWWLRLQWHIINGVTCIDTYAYNRKEKHVRGDDLAEKVPHTKGIKIFA